MVGLRQRLRHGMGAKGLEIWCCKFILTRCGGFDYLHYEEGKGCMRIYVLISSGGFNTIRHGE